MISYQTLSKNQRLRLLTLGVAAALFVGSVCTTKTAFADQMTHSGSSALVVESAQPNLE